MMMSHGELIEKLSDFANGLPVDKEIVRAAVRILEKYSSAPAIGPSNLKTVEVWRVEFAYWSSARKCWVPAINQYEHKALADHKAAGRWHTKEAMARVTGPHYQDVPNTTNGASPDHDPLSDEYLNQILVEYAADPARHLSRIDGTLTVGDLLSLVTELLRLRNKVRADADSIATVPSR